MGLGGWKTVRLVCLGPQRLGVVTGQGQLWQGFVSPFQDLGLGPLAGAPVIFCIISRIVALNEYEGVGTALGLCFLNTVTPAI